MKNIRDFFNLTDEEMLEILDYMYLNKEEFEKEYQRILGLAEEERTYWEERNRDHFEKIRPQSEATIARLRERSAQFKMKTRQPRCLFSPSETPTECKWIDCIANNARKKSWTSSPASKIISASGGCLSRNLSGQV